MMFAVANPRIGVWIGFVYAVVQGICLGAISRVFEECFDGIVAQVILATLGTFLACLFLFSSGLM